MYFTMFTNFYFIFKKYHTKIFHNFHKTTIQCTNHYRKELYKIMILIADLDHTLIYRKYEINCEVTPVEFVKGKPISFMSSKSLDILQSLRTDGTLEFIPCSIRDYSQTCRVTFIQEHLPKFIICENGGRIFIDGKEDIKYRTFIENHYDLSREKRRKRIDDIREFTMRICPAVANLKFSLSNSKLSSQSIDKSIAVKYLIENYHLSDIITSGDSKFDKEFTKLGTHILLPKHSTFSYPSEFRTKSVGTKACEEIFEKIKTL